METIITDGTLADEAKTDRPEATSRTTAGTEVLLPAAMAYCGKRLLDTLEASSLERSCPERPGSEQLGDAAAKAALAALSAPTRELLAWWFGRDACRRRRCNFHPGQREAILHTILAHELFGSDDPQRLFEAACRVWPNDARDTISAGDGRAYRLRMPAGAGGRWVLQALIVWQWAGRWDASGSVRTNRDSNPRFESDFGARLSLFVPERDVPRYADALFGAHDDDGAIASLRSSLMRNAALFLPPHLRRGFAAWSMRCGDGPCVVGLDDSECDRQRVSARLVVDCDTASRDRGAPAAANASCSLSIELDHRHSEAPAHGAVLAELTTTRALRIGALKSVLLVDLGDEAGTAARRCKASAKPRRRHLRPVLPRCLRPALDAGLRALDRFERDTLALREHLGIDAAPALLVLCERPELRHAAAAYARQSGVARETIVVCAADNRDAQLRARVVVDALCARRAVAQSRFCAAVVLREFGADDDRGADFVDTLGAALEPALPPHWHAPSLIETKAENRERIASGRAPETLIDVLPVIAATWPSLARAPSREGQVLPRIATDALPPAAGDLFASELREDASEVDILLPSPADAALRRPLRWLSQQRPGLARARDAQPVRKCVYRHLAWSPRGDGLERGLIDMAEADPNIRAFALFHPLRQPWPAIADENATQDEDRCAPPDHPNALALTSAYAYVVRFASQLPAGAARSCDSTRGAPTTIAPQSRDAMADWCREVNALPAERRQHREWRSVLVQAPLFWSWKRQGRGLSSLLSALADAAQILADGSRAGE